MPSAGPSRSTRPFGDEEASYNVNASLVELVQAVRAAKRIVVICGRSTSCIAKLIVRGGRIDGSFHTRFSVCSGTVLDPPNWVSYSRGKA